MAALGICGDKYLGHHRTYSWPGCCGGKILSTFTTGSVKASLEFGNGLKHWSHITERNDNVIVALILATLKSTNFNLFVLADRYLRNTPGILGQHKEEILELKRRGGRPFVVKGKIDKQHEVLLVKIQVGEFCNNPVYDQGQASDGLVSLLVTAKRFKTEEQYQEWRKAKKK